MLHVATFVCCDVLTLRKTRSSEDEKCHRDVCLLAISGLQPAESIRMILTTCQEGSPFHLQNLGSLKWQWQGIWPLSSHIQFPLEFGNWNFGPSKFHRPNSQFPKARSRLHRSQILQVLVNTKYSLE